MTRTPGEIGASLLLLACISSAPAMDDWPTLRGDAERTGYVEASLPPPFRVVWVRHFPGERLGTAMEPIVGGGRLFAATHSGSLYALDALTGQLLWLFRAHGAFLHSPAFADETVIAASADGRVYAVDATSGELRWLRFLDEGGCSASPLVTAGAIYVGTRAGLFVALDLDEGELRWRQDFGVPVRQTASFSGGRVFVTAEDLRVRALDAATAQILWQSEPLAGQTARDYYPVVLKRGGRGLVVVRTNPVVQMSHRIGEDRHFLCQRAGVDDSRWQNVDAWTRSEKALGNPDLREEEQAAVAAYLKERREARSFFVLDSESGREAKIAPVLWASGCQGAGTPPVALPDGRLFVLYRSAYGNWNHGVAPLVSLGFLDLGRNRISPILHAHGMRPPWNTFWGTADESQNFVIAGTDAFIVHQGTLSRLDLREGELSLVGGNRDTWGGLANLPWARNEWHGPARGGVAVRGSRVYWFTGSRVICFAAGERGPTGKEEAVDREGVRVRTAPARPPLHREDLRRRLASSVKELLSRRWAPLYVEPGLAGREFSFDDSGETFESLAWAYPHLPPELRARVLSFLAEEWERHPPHTKRAWYSLRHGERRERFRVPEALRRPLHRSHHPFGNLHAVWLYAKRCDAWDRVEKAWPALRECVEDFLRTDWRIDPKTGGAFANRYLASLTAASRIAERAGDAEASERTKAGAREAEDALLRWWAAAGDGVELPVFRDIQKWDRFRGLDNLFVRLSPHRAKVWLFRDLTPEVATLVREKRSAAAEKILKTFALLCPTWYLEGEERQVHYGENFVDPPDFSLDAFRAMAWLGSTTGRDLSRYLDIPFCPADLGYITKLALVLEGE